MPLVVEEPMVPVTDELMERMVQAIVDEVDPEQVILFGSRARGDEHESSDIDLIVVEAAPFGPERSRHKELVRLYHALSGFHVPADVLVYSYEDVAYWRDSLNHVLARALREGKVLHEPTTVANHSAVAQGVDREAPCKRRQVRPNAAGRRDETYRYASGPVPLG